MFDNFCFVFKDLKKTYLYITFLHNNTVEHISKAVLDSLHLKIGDPFVKKKRTQRAQQSHNLLEHVN